jgi:hypothetical protein|tara:strand:- start:255 stop:542 length:288 start_codon:yes stop_codon:yes gene_type:complete
MAENIIYTQEAETIEHYEIHNTKGKALTEANTWQNPNKKTRSFSTLKEAIAHLGSTQRKGKVIEFYSNNQTFRFTDSSMKGYQSEVLQRPVNHEQ